ncbi:DUF3006 domain-containing protein [Lactonifactor longoviformis]|uniref:DUF3006 domain-containing protein n=2 Tax=Lactonifactor TaxID=420345 RepID=A0A1M4VH41_9CLOT|nr:DUF3006 domain-containing protein [Lactonifactor longoviformis]SHE68187.1 Protein of unknown function [Lactonifactor longoviformis DSM 17459]
MEDKKKWIVDRIEGAFAVCETLQKKMEEIPLDTLDFRPKEGDVLREKEGVLYRDESATEERKKEIRNKFSKLLKK